MEWHKLMLFCKKFSNRLAIRQIYTTFAPEKPFPLLRKPRALIVKWI